MQLRITATSFELSKDVSDIVERQMRFAITRFSPSIADVSVTLSDESGPKGVPTKKCQVIVRLRPKGQVLVEASDSNFDSAIGRAADRVARGVARHFEKKRHARKYRRRRSSDSQHEEAAVR